MLPDIDSLALFVQAAEQRSLTKAAAACNIGVAGASRRIMLLETRLKTTLFDRTPRGMKLTPAGKELHVRAKTILAQVNEMQLLMKGFGADSHRALRILVSSSAILGSFPTDLAAFSHANTDVELTVQERGGADIVRALVECEADLGLIVDGTPAEGLETFAYERDRLAVLAPSRHAVAAMAELSFEGLLDHRLISLENGSSIMRLLSEQASMVGRAVRPTVQVRGFEGLCRLVQEGLGVGVLPLQVAERVKNRPGLVMRPLPESWAELGILVAVRPERRRNATLSTLLEYLSVTRLSTRAPGDRRAHLVPCS
ncbi:LysR family transcriptional regulator [Mycobacterium sp. 21AC1]|uniref:LysR family transcriptional regulator n=1 Tax=[Mycobacterium] appelbergii TaxID=2939269 RepID=UPI0029391176|nr:LysR family transcriptional regulator [Mycobacterium sp. 21AC1]MDV3123554.1 LysR family transcriptional regulator [Mycobacterium sp. 21AC1]